MFQKPLKRWFRNIIVLLALSSWYPGFAIDGGIKTVMVAALVLLGIQIALQPLLKVLFIPINIITLGMFRWLIEMVHLLIIFALFPQVVFSEFQYQTFSLLGFPIPGGSVNIVFSVILGSIFYRFIRKVVLYLT